MTRAIAFYARSNAIIGGRTRVVGLTLRPTGTDVAIGSGHVVEGPAISLLLAASGRRAALEDLSGPGVATLPARV